MALTANSPQRIAESDGEVHVDEWCRTRFLLRLLTARKRYQSLVRLPPVDVRQKQQRHQ